jgi:16S rRNA (cytosine1402-N4)-methyltransferase
MPHISVLLQSALHYLSVKPGCKYIDATLGGGGHSLAIAKAGGFVLAIDQDQVAHEAAKPALALYSQKITSVIGNFRDLDSIATEYKWKPVSGIIYDLGMSSFQLDDPKRGFTFQKYGPLDMRMDNSQKLTAQKIIDSSSPQSLGHLLKVFGEVPAADLIAKNIINSHPTNSLELKKCSGNHFRQVFQALRIAVNDELTSLEVSLSQAVSLLSPGGRLVVISFHSLEDRLVKNFFTGLGHKASILTPNPIVPQAEEIANNSRSHSAKLRAIEKL